MSEHPRPWIVEQYLDCDLPGDVGRRWLRAHGFATKAEALAYVIGVGTTSSPAEHWRVRPRSERDAELEQP
jgi:hypothetical protein